MLDNDHSFLVTGGLGFVGRHLTEALLALGKEVTVLDNTRTATDTSPPPGAKLWMVDIRDSREVAEAVTGMDVVFHLAANANGTLSITQPRLDFETNTVGTFSLAETLLDSDIRRLVYVSSASVYGTPRRFPMDEDHPTRPFVPYGASKLSGEVTCLALHHSCGLPVVVGRPFCVYGPGANPQEEMVEVGRYLRWHLNDQPIQIVGDLDRKTRDFVHVSDLVAGLMVIADRAETGEVFNIGSGQEISMRQLVDTIGAATGREPALRVIPEVADDTYRLVADISKLEGLGYRPAMPFSEGVRGLADQLGSAPELPGTPTIFVRGQRSES
ncbi:MAG: NAD-dependent epimerase/dehydratase family protein [Pseudonocardiales bacterium]|nr:NAD-dependent epimerase/dehydratase family protein [Pseudonocardiales bacterium]MBV9030525.1 NAD-dependent epimerase/dehydratase family protein [Pseudonocardiales bacterium]MBW0008989.1 NAD-dependent epimerase/dehydratase family protein [Pseudonocardiales bacterium]